MYKIQSKVDKNMSKFCNGSTPWSPQIQTYHDQIYQWHRILQIKTGVFASKNIIKKLFIKLGEYLGQYLSVDTALGKLKEAWKEYRAAKMVASELRKIFQEELMARKAINCKVKPENLQKMMIQDEQAREEGRESRQLWIWNNKCLVLKAKVTDFVTDIIIIVETQEEVMAAAAESDLRHRSQSTGTIFYLLLLEDAFGTCANNKANCNDVIAGSFTLAKDANPFTVSLLQDLEQSASLKDKELNAFTINPSAHHQT